MSEASAMQVNVVYEATLDRTILRRCEPCFAKGVVTPHPLASGHPDGACPVCGAPSATHALPTILATVDQDAAAQSFGA